MNIQIPKVVLKSSALCDAGSTTHRKAASVFTCSRIRDSLSSRNLHSSLGAFHTLVNLSKPYVQDLRFGLNVGDNVSINYMQHLATKVMGFEV